MGKLNAGLLAAGGALAMGAAMMPDEAQARDRNYPELEQCMTMKDPRLPNGPINVYFQGELVSRKGEFLKQSSTPGELEIRLQQGRKIQLYRICRVKDPNAVTPEQMKKLGEGLKINNSPAQAKRTEVVANEELGDGLVRFWYEIEYDGVGEFNHTVVADGQTTKIKASVFRDPVDVVDEKIDTVLRRNRTGVEPFVTILFNGDGVSSAGLGVRYMPPGWSNKYVRAGVVTSVGSDILEVGDSVEGQRIGSLTLAAGARAEAGTDRTAAISGHTYAKVGAIFRAVFPGIEYENLKGEEATIPRETSFGFEANVGVGVRAKLGDAASLGLEVGYAFRTLPEAVATQDKAMSHNGEATLSVEF